MEKKYFPKFQLGDSVGMLQQRGVGEKEHWYLRESQINKVAQTKEGWKYYTKDKFYPLYAEELDDNTKIMEDAVGKGYILTGEVFGLNDVTRPFAEKWIAWANENKDKAISVFEAEREDEREM